MSVIPANASWSASFEPKWANTPLLLSPAAPAIRAMDSTLGTCFMVPEKIQHAIAKEHNYEIVDHNLVLYVRPIDKNRKS